MISRFIYLYIVHDRSRLSLSSDTCTLRFSSFLDVLESTSRHSTILEEEEVARRQVAEDLRLFGSRLLPADPMDTDASVYTNSHTLKRNASDFGVSLDRPSKYHKTGDRTDYGTTAVTAVDWNSGKTRIDAWLNQCAVPLVLPSTRHVSQEANQSADSSTAIENEAEETKVFRNIHLPNMSDSRDNGKPSLVSGTISDLELRPMIYYRNILDKYPLLPVYLARRLAKANHARAERLRNINNNDCDLRDLFVVRNYKTNGRQRRHPPKSPVESDGSLRRESIKGQKSNAYDTALQEKDARERNFGSNHHSPAVSDFWSGGKASPGPGTAGSHSSGINSPLRGNASFDLEDQDLDLPSQHSSGSHSGLRRYSSGLPPPPVKIRDPVVFDCDICHRTIEVSRRLEWQ